MCHPHLLQCKSMSRNPEENLLISSGDVFSSFKGVIKTQLHCRETLLDIFFFQKTKATWLWLTSLRRISQYFCVKYTQTKNPLKTWKANACQYDVLVVWPLNFVDGSLNPPLLSLQSSLWSVPLLRLTFKVWGIPSHIFFLFISTTRSAKGWSFTSPSLVGLRAYMWCDHCFVSSQSCPLMLSSLSPSSPLDLSLQ